MRIRQGNDFIFLWAIERNELPEDFSNAVNIRLHFKNFDCIGEVKSFQIVDGNIVRVEVSPEWASNLGAYRLILSYEFENSSYSDGDRKCVVDVLAFNIVPKTSEADDVSEMAKTTDIMIGLQGLSAYEVWLKDNPESTKEDYFNWLQKPATDAVSLIEDKIETLDTAIQQEEQRELAEGVRLSNEQSRIEAEGLRVSGEVARNTAEGIRVGNESTRVDNEGIRLLAEEDRIDAEETRVENETLRISAELLREVAESDREDAEQLRQTNTSTAIQNANEATQSANSAAELANTKAGEANTAAQNANGAREAIQSDLALKADHGYTGEDTIKTLKEVETDIKNDITNKAFHGYESNPKTLKEVDDKKAEHGYASIEVAKTLKQVEDNASVKIENLVVNGDFRNGLTGWVVAGQSASISEGVVTLSNFTSPTPRLYKEGPFNAGKYFMKARVRSVGDVTPDAISLGYLISSSMPIARIDSPNKGEWYNIVGVADIPSGTGRFPQFIISSQNYEGKVVEIDRNIGIITINLTETFGAGNEPTAEEMDLLISTLGIDYFEGEITIPAQKIMQWQLKLIRKNKNAIIALGGTII